jgi:glycosidase
LTVRAATQSRFAGLFGDVMAYWLDIGVDGLRLDAIPYLIEREGTNCENPPESHAVIKRIRAAVDARYPDRMLLAYNQPQNEYLKVIGWGWFYLSTILDDFSRYIIAW